MKMLLRKNWLKLWPVMILIGLWLLVVITNYKAGTWLLGWDSLVPELNFKLNIGRTFFAAWQEFQGVGLVGGMGHAADLTRELLLVPFSLFLPASTIRYIWTFAMLLVGTLGTNVLAQHIFSSDKKSPQRTFTLQFASLLTAIFYLFNLATVQYFYVPLETFSGFFGFLPWLIWAVLKCLKDGTRKSYLVLFLILFLATSAFYVQTLFVVFLIVVGWLCLGDILKNKKVGLVRSLKVGVIILVVNLFWLLPVAYFTVTTSQATTQAKQTLISTPESQLLNQAAGTPLNLLSLKGYWFDYTDLDANSKTVYLLDAWRNFYSLTPITLASLGISLLSIFGLLVNALKRRSYTLSVMTIGVIAFLFLSAGNGVLGLLFTGISHLLPLFGQIFRVVFTKWSMVFALSLSLGLGYFYFLVESVGHKIQISEMIPKLIGVGLILVSILCVAPIFTGNLFYDRIQVALPQTYLNLFKYLDAQPGDRRIAYLPMNTMWGWNFNSWGYRGSGFIWYGIKQPILDRNFDVWSPANESFYDEFSTALFGQNTTDLFNVAQKYQVSYFLLDESVITQNQNQNALTDEQIKTELTKIGAISVWHDSFLTLYQLTAPNKDTSFLNILSNPPNVSALTQKTRKDVVYNSSGNYMTDANQPFSTSYPFADLLKESGQNYTYQNGQIIGSHDISNLADRAVLNLGKLNQAYTLQATLNYVGQVITISFSPAYSLKIDQTQINQPVLDTITVDLPYQSDTTILMVGGKQLSLTQGKPLQTNLNFDIGQEIKLSYLDAHQVTIDPNGQKVIYSSQLTNQIIPATTWDKLVLNYPTNLTQKSSITVTIPTVAISLPITQQAFPFNCDPLHRGSVNQAVSTDQATYMADNFGTACIGAGLPFLSTKDSYLISFSGTNLEGRSLRWYLQNNSSVHADLEELLPSASFEQSYSIMPWPNLTENSYYLNWETKSFGEKSQNTLKAINFYPVPLETLANINLGVTNQTYNDIHAATSDIWKLGTYEYGLDIATQQTGKVLSLGQGFSNGWLAVAASKEDGFKFQILHHVQVDGWNNGWTLPAGDYSIVIIYWPQFLIFGSLLLLPFATWYFLRHT